VANRAAEPHAVLDDAADREAEVEAACTGSSREKPSWLPLQRTLICLPLASTIELQGPAASVGS